MKKIAGLLLFTCLLGVSSCSNGGTTGIIAHRGFWNTGDAAKNSIAAFQAAVDAGYYGSEFDVYLTVDSALVVYHDRKIEGKFIDSCSCEELAGYRLSNGEPLPLMKDILEIAKKQSDDFNNTSRRQHGSNDRICTKPIIEIKTHSTADRNIRAAGAVYAMVKSYGLENQVEYISFGMDICKELIRLDDKAKVAYLGGDRTPSELKAMGFTGLDYSIGVMKKHPEWFDEAAKNDITVNVWTVNKREDMIYCIEHGADFITTDNTVLLKSLL